MKKSSVIIFIATLLVVILLFGIAIWSAKREVNKELEENAMAETQIETNMMQSNEITNIMDTNTQTTGEALDKSYEGTWYISELDYINANTINNAIEQKEKGEMTDAEYEELMASNTNGNVTILNVKSINGNQVTLDFTLESPAPTRRVGEIKDITVTVENLTGSFTYTDNWGTEGSGTITFADNKVILKLETTKAAEGTQWGVEGSYEMTYKFTS